MSYQLVARPGAGHQGIEPLVERLGDCCSSCSAGGPCGTGAAELNPIKLTVGIAGLILGYVMLKRAAAE